MEHAVPSAFLTLPAAGEDTLPRLLRKLRMTAFRRLLAAPEPALAELRPALVALAKRAPDALLDAVGEIDVLTPLLVQLRDSRERPELVRAAIPNLLAALAGDRLETELRWVCPIRAVVDRRAAVLRRFDPPAAAMLAGPDGCELTAGCETTTHPFHPLLPGKAKLHLSEYDSNPLAMVEEHPDKRGNAVSLGGRDVDEWLRALGMALDAIRLALPAWFAELDCALTRIVPVGFDAERHSSASYREAPGLAYLSLHPSVLTLAEAIVHEAQHSKLNVMRYFDPLLTNGATEWARSEVRPDVRPLEGVLLAVHAFVPVAVMHRALAELHHPIADSAEFADRRAELLELNARGLETIERLGAPTRVGHTLLDSLRSAQEFAAATS